MSAPLYNFERVQRLRLLVTVLRRVPDDHKSFDMGQWVSDPNNLLGSDHEGLPPCGTSACAMGHAALSPEFRALGLSVSNHGTLRFLEPGDDPANMVSMRGIEIAENLFGIKVWEADDLFLSSGYYNIPGVVDTIDIRPSHVIAKVEALIAEYGG